MAQARMKKQFLALFPDAVDLIVRAIRAGLPISAALDAVGKEMSDPIGKEFRLLVADFKIGMTFEEAMRRAADRVNLLEFSFFTASLILQRETGGNLAETLETLGSVLRRRHEMTLKTNTLTSEARTSAYVMTAMPFFVAGALFFLSPGYLNVYVTDPRGSWILGMALVSLCTGIGIMRIMLSQAMK
jgi:tight adherence protein B